MAMWHYSATYNGNFKWFGWFLVGWEHFLRVTLFSPIFFKKRFSWRPSWFYSFCAAKTNKNLFIILVDPQNWYVDIKNLGSWLLVMVNFWTFLEHFPKKGSLWRPHWIFSKSLTDSFRPTSDLKSAEKNNPRINQNI